jgi:hypothetical protein
LYTAALLLPALSALPFAQTSRAARANTSFQHTIIALSGTAAPAGGNYLAQSFLNATLNARHEVAFDATVSGPSGVTTGVFVGDGETASTIALGINPAGTSFGFVSNPFITPNGDVVFDVNGGDIFMNSGRTIVALVRDGDLAPGGGTGNAGGRARSERPRRRRLCGGRERLDGHSGNLSRRWETDRQASRVMTTVRRRAAASRSFPTPL